MGTISPVTSLNIAGPSVSPGGSALTAQIEKGEVGVTSLLVYQLSPKVTFVFPHQNGHHLPGTATSGAAIPRCPGREQRRV